MFYNRKLVKTKDGSHSLFVEELNEHYHSIHGALQESQHVFIAMGLQAVHADKKPIRIYELGLGTGLNALLTCVECREKGLSVEYTASEAYPLSPEEAQALNYGDLLGEESKTLEELHRISWGERHAIHPGFSIEKRQEKTEGHEPGLGYDLIYFDAFAPEKQPELWEDAVFENMYAWLGPGGILTTYCAKGVVRRRMQAAGFTVERLPGPPGKREMLRGRKNQG